MTLLEIAKKHNLKAWQLANLCDVNITQIYKWNKNGISKDNPHWETLAYILPELEHTGSNKKCNRGRKKKTPTLYATDLEPPKSERPRPSERPIVIIRRKSE